MILAGTGYFRLFVVHEFMILIGLWKLRLLGRMSGTGVRLFFFFQAEDGIRDYKVTGVQTCALPICPAISSSDQIPCTSPGRMGDGAALGAVAAAGVSAAAGTVAWVERAALRCLSQRGTMPRTPTIRPRAKAASTTSTSGAVQEVPKKKCTVASCWLFRAKANSVKKMAALSSHRKYFMCSLV